MTFFQDPGVRMQDAGYRIQDAGSWFQVSDIIDPRTALHFQFSIFNFPFSTDHRHISF